MVLWADSSYILMFFSYKIQVEFHVIGLTVTSHIESLQYVKVNFTCHMCRFNSKQLLSTLEHMGGCTGQSKSLCIPCTCFKTSKINGDLMKSKIQHRMILNKERKRNSIKTSHNTSAVWVFISSVIHRMILLESMTTKLTFYDPISCHYVIIVEFRLSTWKLKGI